MDPVPRESFLKHYPVISPGLMKPTWGDPLKFQFNPAFDLGFPEFTDPDYEHYATLLDGPTADFSTTILSSLHSVVMFIYNGRSIDNNLFAQIHTTPLMLTHQMAPPVLCSHFHLHCKPPLLLCKQLWID